MVVFPDDNKDNDSLGFFEDDSLFCQSSGLIYST